MKLLASRESACGRELCNGRKTWNDAVFLERGGGAVEHWFLDIGLMQDFGILDVNGIRAAYRAVKTPRPYVCPECNDAFETLRQLDRHSDQHVCMEKVILHGEV